MGVTKLWQLLEEAGEGMQTTLSKCSGQSWAVDLSVWIVHGRTAGMTAGGVSPTFTMIRTAFYRALCLLKHGIRPVIVMDGRMAPEIKSQTLQDRCERTHGYSKSRLTGNERSGLESPNRLCQQMLKSLGLKVITSSGEAEKTCALLNSQGLVDACLSDDSDIFLYGAKTVYRNLDVKTETVEKHTMHSIEGNPKLRLCRQDLVSMAVLSGCDYGDGVKSVGPKKVLELVHSMKNYCQDVLPRVQNWRDHAELSALAQKRMQLSTTRKSAHCTKCQHPGSKPSHKTGGCHVCQSPTDCKDGDADDKVLCTCEYHQLEQSITPYKAELDMREKAIKDKEFPNNQIVEEFLNSTETFDFDKVEVAMPAWGELAAELQMNHEKLMGTMIPVLLMMHLHGILELPNAQPISIIRESKQRSVPCYLVQWKQFDFDKWTSQPSSSGETTPLTKEQTSNNPYIIDVPRELFENKYPKLVERHKLNLSMKKGKGKRPQTDSSQGKMTDFFTVSKVKKQLFTDTTN